MLFVHFKLLVQVFFYTNLSFIQDLSNWLHIHMYVISLQMIRDYRKPVVVVAPKILLRLPAAASSLSDMAPGTTFQPVLGDLKVKGEKVTKVVFCTGKHYYLLQKEREARNVTDMALIRVEVWNKSL